MSRIDPAADRNGERGFALVMVLMLSAVIAALLTAHFLLTRVDLSMTKSAMDSTRGFYAAEAGLNIRAETIRKTFLGYNRPSGTSPMPIPGQLPCDTGSHGSGDFACDVHSITGRTARTFVEEDPSNPRTILIPPGEDFASLTAQEYTYDVTSIAVNRAGRPEAILEMQFNSRLIPLFQFAAFYDKDLEILPGPNMTLAGPVHVNGNLFLDCANTLTIDGQVTTSSRLFRGRKNDGSCSSGTVSVHDLSGPLATATCPGGNRYELNAGDVDGTNPPNLDWEGRINVDAADVEVPPPEEFDPASGATYWDLADLRIMLDLVDPADPVKVYDSSGNVDWANTANLTGCSTAVGSTSGDFFNVREGTAIEMLEVDVRRLMDCIELTVPGLMGGRTLSDTTEGGLVWYFGVDDGINAAAPNNYGVRIQGGATLSPTSGSNVAGLTIVTNQALYVEGDFNQDDGVNWRPAAFLADSLNVLSNNWLDANSTAGLGSRVATTTTIRAAFLAGTDTSGGPGGEGALDTGAYNGGLENYPRFHEDWSSATLTYRGSFVSLNQPIRVSGTWASQSYSPPTRDWGFEGRFNNAANFPPLTPRVVYLKHSLFVREFEY